MERGNWKSEETIGFQQSSARTDSYDNGGAVGNGGRDWVVKTMPENHTMILIERHFN